MAVHVNTDYTVSSAKALTQLIFIVFGCRTLVWANNIIHTMYAVGPPLCHSYYLNTSIFVVRFPDEYNL